MSEHTHRLAGPSQEEFEIERRGYNRRQVDEFVAKSRSQTREARDLENRLSRALDDNERLRLELAGARQAATGRPAHEEVSERVGQILKLADDEARSQRKFAADEIAKLRDDAKQEAERLRAEAKQETDKFRAEAQNQAERMLRAAQEQAENSVAGARAEAEKTRGAARAEAERSITDAQRQAESTVSAAKAQAKQVLDEATARATAIHDGAERRLNLLMSRHTEAIRRLTEIRDVVTTLVAGEVTRGSLEDEVDKAVASSFGATKPGPGGRAAGPGPGSRAAGPADGRFAPTGAAAAGPAGPAAAGPGSGPGGPGVAPPAPAAPPTASASMAQQAARTRGPEQGPRTQPTPANPAAAQRTVGVPGAGNGTGTTDPPPPNPGRQGSAVLRIPNTEGARRPAGATRPGSADDTMDSVRVVPEDNVRIIPD